MNEGRLTSAIRLRFWQFVISLVAALSMGDPALCYAQTTVRQPLPLDEAKVSAYSKAFAKRFGLTEGASDFELSGGIQAIQFSMEMGPKFAPYYLCKFKVYLDSSLPIAYPLAGVSGSRDLVQMPEHFIYYDGNIYLGQKRWLSLGAEDRRYFSEQDKFRNRAALASPDVQLPTRGYWAGVVYDSFYQELFPGITYIKFDSNCGSLADGAKSERIQLWIERVGGKDYSRIVYPDSADFLKFDLPIAFYKAVVKWAKPADEYNRAVIDGKVAKERDMK